MTELEDVNCVKLVTKLGKAGRTVYMYIVDGMLIDTGPVILLEELIPFYQEHSFNLVMLTHSHEDHTGTASWIKENKNVPIYIHPKGIEICEKPVSYPMYRQQTWGIRKPFEVLPVESTIQSANLEWKVIYTPGHANDHVSLFHEESGRLFAGDLYISPETKIIMKDESIPMIIHSIRKLLSLNFESLFCSHTGFVPNGRAMLRKKMIYLEEIYAKVEELYNQGNIAYEIKRKLFPKNYKLIEYSEGEYDTLHIVTSILEDIKRKINI
ncbi:MBL fold metallo-hydrolase [Oceanobacillus senegalensis]|uniref:MBL fold metallo-hydrolase n=1 Tax=Oceanobacillus senegalensis TaxID=1936063 RepID=UPI001FEBE6DA|nr:MBL fold metallo-hydrolase [Oceanobacillus senegalensis]